MPLGLGIVDACVALPERIEVSGHAPTWTVTAGSFESALDYANARFGNPAVLARRDRYRWWPRVSLTVTTDPYLAACAPPVDVLAAQPRAGNMPRSLEAIFAHQEEQRMTAGRIHEQR